MNRGLGTSATFGGPFMRLVTAGRTTGIPHIVRVRFLFLDESFYVLGGTEGSDWMKNALSSGRAKVRIGELAIDATAVRITREERSRVIELFERKYGERVTREWYSPTAPGLRLAAVKPPTVRGELRGESEVRTSLKEWKSRNSDYYGGVATAFDSASEEYDFTIRNNFINVWIRRRSIEELRSIIKKDDVLLEIGCGTGAEAIELSRYVSGIVATDISSSMIKLLERKVQAKNLRHKILAAQIPASDIHRVAGFLPKTGARVAYSFNGALNCEPRIRQFPGELWKVMEDDGYFICSVRNILCLSEALAHGMVMQFDKMAPRKKQPTMVSVGGMDIPSFYYPPSGFALLFRPYFETQEMVGLPSILPPAYLSDIYVRARRALSFVERAERVLASRFPFNRWGDQTLFVFKKRKVPVGVTA